MAHIIRRVPIHPLPRSERKRNKNGKTVGGTSRRVKAVRAFGNEQNRQFFCHPHAHRLDPKRFARLSARAHSLNGFTPSGE